MMGPTFVTTTEEAASRVLKDGADFGLRKDGGTAAARWWMPGIFRALGSNLLTTDEPDHTRLRGIVDEAFHRRAIIGMTPRVEALADELAASLFADGSPADLVDRSLNYMPPDPVVDPAEIGRQIALWREFGMVTADISPADVIDNSVLADAKAKK